MLPIRLRSKRNLFRREISPSDGGQLLHHVPGELHRDGRGRLQMVHIQPGFKDAVILESPIKRKHNIRPVS